MFKTIIHTGYKHIKLNKRTYLSFMISIIFIVIFFVLILLGGQGIKDRFMDNNFSTFGEYDLVADVTGQDGALLKSAGIDDSSIGYVSVYGSLQNEKVPYEDEIIIGSFDTNALKTGRITLKEGRMPANANEIAVEYAAYVRMDMSAKVGEKVVLDFGEGNTVSFTLSGILNDYANIRRNINDTLALPAIITNARDVAPTKQLALCISGNATAACTKLNNRGIYSEANSYIANFNNAAVMQATNYAQMAFIGLISLIGIFSLISAVRVYMDKNYQRILLLKMLGVDQSKIYLLFFCEIILIGFLSVMIVYPIALLLLLALAKLLPSMLLLLINTVLFLKILGICIAVLVALLAVSVLPIVNFCRKTSVSALKNVKLIKNKAIKNKKDYALDYFIKKAIYSAKTMRILPRILIVIMIFIVALTSVVVNFSLAQLYPTMDYDYYFGSSGGSIAVIGVDIFSDTPESVINMDYINTVNSMEGIKDLKYTPQASVMLISATKLQSDDRTVIEPIDSCVQGLNPADIEAAKEKYGYKAEDYLYRTYLLAYDDSYFLDLLSDGQITKSNYDAVNTGESVLVSQQGANIFKIGDTVNLSMLVDKNSFYSPDNSITKHDQTLNICAIDYTTGQDGTLTFITSKKAIDKLNIPMYVQDLEITLQEGAAGAKAAEKIEALMSKYPLLNYKSNMQQQEARAKAAGYVYTAGYCLVTFVSIMAFILLFNINQSTIYSKLSTITLFRLVGANEKSIKRALYKQVIFQSLWAGISGVLFAYLFVIVSAGLEYLKYISVLPLVIVLITLGMGTVLTVIRPINAAFSDSICSAIRNNNV